MPRPVDQRGGSGGTWITALTSLAALVFTALSLRATGDQIYITEQGQITDRFSKAVEQLGSQGPDLVDVRLGGIYALERIAHDSPTDQPTIIEVLAAFVRNHAPKTKESKECTEKPRVATDVQAALTVLGRRDARYDDNVTINLNATCLSRADFKDANLIGANLTEANLSHSRFVHAKLIRANLKDTELNDADFTDHADFTNRADLRGADLTCAHLNHAHFNDAILAEATLKNVDDGGDGADFTGADLTHADLTVETVDANGTCPHEHSLAKSKFMNAILTRAILTDAKINLTGARR